MGKRRSGGNKQWEVESIVNSKYDEEEGKLMYEIKWKGFTDTTWEPEGCLANCPLILQGQLVFEFLDMLCI